MSDAEPVGDTTKWTWKVSEDAKNVGLNLRYEPGNWGDVLKGEWAVRLTRALARSGLPRIRFLDPFAGAPTYPLVESAAARLDERPPCPAFLEAQAPFVARGELASTGSLVLAAADAAGVGLEALVYDLDATRLAAWRSRPVSVLEVASGAEALEAAPPRDLVLLDPYDLFDAWGSLLPRVLPFAREAALLLYLYNKAPRGAGHQRQYASFRRSLARELADLPRPARALVGRVPSDAVLPRAFHEVVLVASAELAGELEPELAATTRELALRLAAGGAWETVEADPGA